jgi:6-phosphogluconate dehydrogenase
MQLGMIGLGRMGANIVRRLIRAGHTCVVFDTHPQAVADLVKEGAQGAPSLEEFAAKLEKPRAAWIMVPAAVVDKVIAGLQPHLEKGDIIIDGGNSYFRDDRRRAAELSAQGLHYIDCGTSGGIWGLDRGYCLMIGGEKEPVTRLDPIFRAIAPGRGDLPRTEGRDNSRGTAEDGYLHCGQAGAGHFVKMVHNGIEYGMMAALAEGFDILQHADTDSRPVSHDAETAPRMSNDLDYDLPVGEIAELWRRGSVVQSWLLDLIAISMAEDPELKKFSGRVSDSGEGRWTIMAAIEAGVPADVLSAALYARFRSQEPAFSDKVCSAMRYQFGGHIEKPAGG